MRGGDLPKREAVGTNDEPTKHSRAPAISKRQQPKLEEELGVCFSKEQLALASQKDYLRSDSRTRKTPGGPRAMALAVLKL